MKQNQRLSYRERLAFATTLALILITAGTCGACLDRFASPYEPRTPQEQHLGSVKIIVTCAVRDPKWVVSDDPNIDILLDMVAPDIEQTQMGTGGMVSSAHLLTNVHVVTCVEGKLKTIVVDTGNGIKHPASIDVLVPAHDIARLQLEAPLDVNIPPPTIGPTPDIGDRICYASAVPRWGYTCGTVQPSANVSQIIIGGAQIQHGNSGGLSYDNQGRLVGLIYALEKCEYDIPCLGAITNIQGYSWLAE